MSWDLHPRAAWNPVTCQQSRAVSLCLLAGGGQSCPEGACVPSFRAVWGTQS